MTLKEIREKRARVKKMHEENIKRTNKDVVAQVGMMGGIALTMLGGILTAVTAGIVPIIISCVGFVGGLTGYGVHIGLETKDRQAINELRKEFPDKITKPSLLSDYALVYSGDMLEHLDDLENEVLVNGEKEDELKDLFVIDKDHQVGFNLDKIVKEKNNEKEDEIGE